MVNLEEQKTIRFFLKEGFSTRKIDSLLGYNSQETKGWKSWKLLQKYNIKEKHRHALFLFSENEIKSIIDSILKSTDPNSIEDLIAKRVPKVVAKYQSSYLACKGEKELSSILSGEIRNITQQFFKKNKSAAGNCQVKGCTNTKLDTVHLNDRRPNILKQAASKAVIGEINNLKVFDIQKTIINYLSLHSKAKTICYLCRQHHLDLEKLETKGPKNKYRMFVKNIIF